MRAAFTVLLLLSVTVISGCTTISDVADSERLQGEETHNTTPVTEREDPVYYPGERIYTRANLEGSGEQPGEFAITMSVVSDRGGRRFNFKETPDGDVVQRANSTMEVVHVEPGDEKTVELYWEVSRLAPEGNYSVVLEAWLETNPEDFKNLMGRDRYEDALEIRKHKGRLVIEDTGHNATFFIQDVFDRGSEIAEEYAGLNAPIDIALPAGRYEIKGLKGETGDPGLWKDTVDIYKDEITTIRPDFRDSPANFSD